MGFEDLTLFFFCQGLGSDEEEDEELLLEDMLVVDDLEDCLEDDNCCLPCLLPISYLRELVSDSDNSLMAKAHIPSSPNRNER